MTLDQTPPNVHRVHPFLLLAVDCPMVSWKGRKGKMRKLRVILILMLYEYHHFFLMKLEYLMIVFESKLCGQLQRLCLLKEEGIEEIKKRKWRRRGSRDRRIDMFL